ncbi:PAS domain S-box protein [Lichenibacterium minor]|uniref:histidine kinase n=1 Tax=Lichenibacterium minor TaxID=2316528 RepID=A0A4V1RU56_9HYPH|nr:PAS domain S-box protein [Lichenibacterium minor]RYC29984.1 PAS domain S-box protein [Lichenibacterium minor]
MTSGPTNSEAASVSTRELERVAGPLFATIRRSGMAMAVTDPRLPDNPIVFANAAFLELTGYAAEEVIGRNCRFLQDGETDPATVDTLREALKLGREVTVEIRNRRRDGSPFWNRLSIAPVPSHGGQPDFFFSTQHDCSADREAALAEEALRDTEDQLRSTTEWLDATLEMSGAGATWDWDVARSRIVGDGRFAALYGLDPASAAAGIDPATFFSVVHPDDRPRIRLAVGAVLRGADVFSKEYRVTVNGAVRWVRARGRCRRDAEDRPLRFGGVLIDVTEHKLVEEQLRIAQTAGGIGTFTYVDGFATATVSAQFCRLLGLQAANALPVRTVNAVAAPEGPPIIAVAAHGAPGAARQDEIRIRRPDDGEERWVMCRGEYAVDTESSSLRFTGVIYDVTEAKRTEERLRDVNQALTSGIRERTRERDRIWQVSRDMLGVADSAGVWLSVNPAWTRVLGWDADAIVGRTSEWLEHPDDRAKTAAAVATLSRSGTTAAFENRFLARDGGYRHLSWTIVSDEGQGYCVTRDVTEEKERAAALAQVEEALRQSQKMEAVGQLTGGVAHDFNNLLTIIRSSTDLLRRPGLAEERRKRYLDAVSDTVDRAAKLTGQLLAFARRQALKPEVFDAAERVRSVADMLDTVTGARIRVLVEVPDTPCHLRADPSQFETALVNMAVNARDAMDGEGTLTVRLQSRIGMPPLRGHGGSDGRFAALSLGDTGSGIAPDTMARIFEPFFTTKEIGKGTGLGLSQVFGFAKQSGGDVDVRSELGRGTVFTLFLPQIEADVDGGGQGAEADERGHSLGGEGRHVLVVEDNVEIGQFATQVLQDLGYRTTWAANAVEALAVLAERRADVHIVFSDVVMPGMNGVDLAREIRGRHPDLPVVLTSGYSHVLAQHGTSGFDLLHKPYSAEGLSRILGRALR